MYGRICQLLGYPPNQVMKWHPHPWNSIYVRFHFFWCGRLDKWNYPTPLAVGMKWSWKRMPSFGITRVTSHHHAEAASSSGISSDRSQLGGAGHGFREFTTQLWIAIGGGFLQWACPFRGPHKVCFSFGFPLKTTRKGGCLSPAKKERQPNGGPRWVFEGKI